MRPNDDVVGCLSGAVVIALVVAVNLALLALAVWIVKAVWT